MARDLSRRQALDLATPILRLGTDFEVLTEGQRSFAEGERIEPRTR